MAHIPSNLIYSDETQLTNVSSSATEKVLIGLMEEERVFILTHKASVSFPTCPLAQPTSWVSHSLLHQSSLLTRATEPAHSGVAHCELHQLSDWQQHPIAHRDAPSFWPGFSCFSGQGPRTAGPWDGDRLSESLSMNLIQHATGRNDIKAPVNKIFDSKDKTANCLVEWTCKSSKHQSRLCRRAER